MIKNVSLSYLMGHQVTDVIVNLIEESGRIEIQIDRIVLEGDKTLSVVSEDDEVYVSTFLGGYPSTFNHDHLYFVYKLLEAKRG